MNDSLVPTATILTGIIVVCTSCNDLVERSDAVHLLNNDACLLVLSLRPRVRLLFIFLRVLLGLGLPHLLLDAHHSELVTINLVCSQVLASDPRVRHQERGHDNEENANDEE